MGTSNSKSSEGGKFHNRARSESNLSISMGSTASLQMVRERDARRHTFNDIYKVESEIGQGGLCTVYRIRKINGKIGGSSRPENVIRPRARTIVFPIPPSPKHTRSVKRLDRLPSDMSKYLANVAGATEPMCFALKVFNLALLKEEKVTNLHSEVEILSHMDHPFIVKLFETFETKKPQRLSLVMELCTGTCVLWSHLSPCRLFASPSTTTSLSLTHIHTLLLSGK
jgi:serine/threonine protein kinase